NGVRFPLTRTLQTYMVTGASIRAFIPWFRSFADFADLPLTIIIWILREFPVCGVKDEFIEDIQNLIALHFGEFPRLIKMSNKGVEGFAAVETVGLNDFLWLERFSIFGGVPLMNSR